MRPDRVNRHLKCNAKYTAAHFYEQKKKTHRTMQMFYVCRAAAAPL